MQTRENDPVVLLLITDNHHARLLSCARLRTGHVHVDVLSTLKEQWDQKGHPRHASRDGAWGHTFENLGHTVEERAHRFAKEIAGWLGQELPKHSFERLSLFAAPRVLGALRREAPASLQHNWIEHQVDLAGMTEGELAQRPEIMALVPAVKSPV